MENVKALPCIVCGKHLDNAADEVNQPYQGTAFSSSGHYGSTIFDPMDGSHIEINVCDYCLGEAREKGFVLHGRHGRRIVFEGSVVGFLPVQGVPQKVWKGNEEHWDYQATRSEVEHASTCLPEAQWNVPPESLL